jgi:uncharacterized protein with FMN-binding domain
MRSLHDSKTPLVLLAGLSLAGILTGCSTAADTDTGNSDETTETDSTETDSGATDSGDGSATYTDGTYTESANYQSPNGSETVEVTITLEGDIITAVTVVGDGDNPDSKRYQGEFADGIAAVVVGKDIDEISVSKVAGSSLTSAGFNEAVDAIKADAS